MDKKTCIITGATSGIGRAAALELGAKGWDLWLVGRSAERGNRVVKSIQRMGFGAKARFVAVDLSSLRQVRSFARQVCDETDRLDVLLNNAGARNLEFGRSEEGLERTFAANHLGHFVLTLLLLGKLRESEAGRVVNVASSVHSSGRGDFDRVLKAEPYDGRMAYAESKLANLLFTFELARRVDGCGITVNAVDPGGVATRFSLNNGLVAWARHIVYYLKQRSLLLPRQACQTLVYLASSPEVSGISGRYFSDKREITASPQAADRDLAERLWRMSMETAGLRADEVGPEWAERLF